ncbi:MAG: sensor histidine kinase [Gemmatimonadaceae bacterium]
MGTRARILNFAIWTLVGAFQASSWVLAPFTIGRQYSGRLIAVAMFNAYVWALLTPAVFRLAAWMNRDRDARLRRVPLVVALGLAVSVVVTVMAFAVHRLLLPLPTRGVPQVSAWLTLWHMGRWYGQQVVEFFAILVVAVALEMRRRFHVREREAAQLESQASQLQAERAELSARTAQLQAQSAELQAQLAEARLTVLRARLNPHFLFNTLNAVSALVANDPRGVRNMIALLSELLRHALAESSEQEIPLRDELRLLRLYLEILEIRYQGQLRTIVTADPGVQDALVPNLILQPLVENAMKHGIDRAGGHGTIEMRASRVGDDLVLTVRDTGPGQDPAPPSRTSGVGLRLTRERLAELYGGEQGVELQPMTGGGMIARIALPYHTSDDLRVAEEVAQQ